MQNIYYRSFDIECYCYTYTEGPRCNKLPKPNNLSPKMGQFVAGRFVAEGRLSAMHANILIHFLQTWARIFD